MKRIMVLLGVMLFSLSLLAQGNIQNPFLWKVTKEHRQFYLFGTMHLAVPELQILPQSLTSIINQSDHIYIEVPMDVATQLKASKLSMREDGKPLKEILPSKLYHACDSYLKSLSPYMRLDFFDKMKIWAISSTLGGLKTHLAYPNLRPIDKIIYDYAKAHHKEVRGIETIEEQLGIMDTFTRQEQLLGLESTLDQLTTQEDLTDRLKSYYLQGESKPLLAFLNSTLYQIPKYKSLEDKLMQRLLYDRNVRMARRIDEVVAKAPHDRYLFAFGVMHFLGMKSVIGYLKTYGYRVERLK